MTSFSAHSKAIDSLLFIIKEGHELFMVSSGQDGETKVWNIAQLLNSDIDVKKPLLVYNPKKELTTCLCNLGNFLSLPILGIGDNQGQIKLAAIAQGTKSREMIIGSWKASSDPIKQLEKLEETNIVASLDINSVKMWRFALSEEGLKDELLYSLDDSNFQLSGSKGNVACMEWLFPRTEISVGYSDDAAIRVFDINRGSPTREFSLEEKPSRMISETSAEV